ncbi:MAG TPA: isopentenyl-diphosphate Delta-isomerase [Candidatus Avipropionibacterium avicola]|uniref:Isopentenyl-diphosphate Delta-isomerase n=1 Tax=Candidatus Avipropionibacterium avicola TaxID=2840701 RepID=A0A9D1GZ17_9ACTN|nr:isopentenyl-diphosphate Delta-isomerase [Candidatus Avipropionibacterium avicola]
MDIADPAVADHVVLLDGRGHQIGVADRRTVHSTATPRHLAFSCWLVAADGRVLITRRALGKRTWPGVWTNSCCGHPRPDEQLDHAVRRRVHEELGVELDEVVCALPDFSYRAVDRSGLVENELCPMFHATAVDGELSPDPHEVVDWTWEQPERLRQAMTHAPYAFSPWARQQLPLLGDLSSPLGVG